MKRSSAPITFRVGHREFIKVNATKYDWRDIYHFILTLRWPQFIVLLLGINLIINLCFATLYLLGEPCISGLAPGSFSDAFFFSVETLATVGYGHAYPDTLYGHWVATLETMVGLFGLAVMTGLIFVRFSRPTARIKFSNVAVLRLQFDHLINFPAALTLRHVIDETSPLFGLTPEDLKLADSRMLASVVCVDPVIQAPVQTQTEYLHEQIAWNRRFAEIYTEDSFGRYTVDYSKFHDTLDVSPQ
jgi:inward rectifier potassium channel